MHRRISPFLLSFCVLAAMIVGACGTDSSQPAPQNQPTATTSSRNTRNTPTARNTGANQAGDRDGDGIPDADDECPDEPENINKVFDTDGCPDTLKTLVDYAAGDINDFWKKTFEAENIRYDPPTEFIGYGREIRTACGPGIPNNAFYCGESHAIYYHADFLQEQLDTDGDFAPVTIVAHEWGHLIQANLGLLGSDRHTIEIELQADCFAGAWAKNAGEEGLLEEGDLEEGATALFRAGDDLSTPWFDPGAHGQPDQRIEAFSIGVDNGVSGCFNDDTGWRSPAYGASLNPQVFNFTTK